MGATNDANMEASNGEISVEELMARIREEMARRRAEHSPSMTRPVPPPVPTAVMDWSRLDRTT